MLGSSIRPMRHRRAQASHALVVGLLGTLSMLAAHCGGYQLVYLLESPAAPDTMAMSVHPGHGHHAAMSPPVVDAHSGHAHVVPVASGAFLALLVVLVCLGALATRRIRVPPPSASALFAVQVGLLVSMEGVERHIAGVDPVAMVADRRVLLAIALQLPAALLVARLGRKVVEVAAVVAAVVAAAFGRVPRRVRVAAAIPERVAARPVRLQSAQRGWPPSLRGPPRNRPVPI